MTPLRIWMGQEPSGRCSGPAPLECGASRLQQPGRGQRHRVFDVIPGIGMAAIEPGNGARGFLRGGDRLRGLTALRRRQHAWYAGNFRQH